MCEIFATLAMNNLTKIYQKETKKTLKRGKGEKKKKKKDTLFYNSEKEEVIFPGLFPKNASKPMIHRSKK